MKYLKQWLLILCFTAAGEVLKSIFPFRIPAGIYELMLLFMCLETGILKKKQIQETAYFLIRVMPVMFIPAAAGITEAGKELGNIWLPALIAVTAVTMAVTAVSALAAQKACRKRRAE